MQKKLASAILTLLLYTQGLLGIAGLTTVILKDIGPEPTFVHGLEAVDAQYTASVIR